MVGFIVETILLSMISLLIGAAMTLDAPLAPARLRTCALEEPLGLDRSPRFSWEVQDPRPGARQSAYRILVATDPKKLARGEGDLWDSGKVRSTETAHVAFRGKKLPSYTDGFWMVQTFDADGNASPWSKPARFGTGPLAVEDWIAQWIGDPSPAPEVIAARNGYHSDMEKSADVEKWVTLDLGKSRTFDQVVLFPAQPHDWQPSTPGFLFPVEFQILGSEHEDFSDARVLWDSRGAFKNPGANPVTLDCPGTARYVRLRVSQLAERNPGFFGIALAEFEVHWSSKPISTGSRVWAKDSVENADWSAKFLTDGDRRSHGASGMEALPATQVRTEIDLRGKPRRAILTMTALGAYRAWINGKPVGQDILPPEWTDYHARVQSQTHDVTSLLQKGPNAVAAWIGDGWYAGRLGMSQALDEFKRPRGVYGRTTHFLAQLRVTYADGSVETFGTGPQWRTSKDGPIRSADLYDGEYQDATMETRGWLLPGFDDRGWSVPLIAPAATPPVPGSKPKLVDQPNEPIRVVARLKPLAITSPRDGIQVVDFGQNMVGVVHLRVRGAKRRDTVSLIHAEMLNEDGTVYTANLRGAPQRDTYVAKGEGEERFEPLFTYHGFRYVQIEGLRQQLEPGDIEGIVFCSSSPEVGSFDTSSPLLNKIWSNVLWTQRANLMSTPTDCPQRDERLGWMGDILVFAPSACLNMDMEAFFTKWFADVRDAQADDGRFPDFAPHPYGRNRHFTGVPGWGDAGVFVPWTSYRFYADKSQLADQFGAAKRWVDWIAARNPNLLWQKERHNDYNDWLNADTFLGTGPKVGATVPNEVFATLFLYRSTQIVAEMARALGRKADAALYADRAAKVRTAFRKEYLYDDGKMRGDTQAGYALGWVFGLFDRTEAAAVRSHLESAIERYQGRLTTGFHSTRCLLLALDDLGRTDIAYRLALSTEFPGWGYSITNDATTIWERWDGYVKGRGFQDAGMNSFNHWAFGAITEWLVGTVLGIEPLGQDGFRTFRVRPRPGGGLTWAKGSYRSLRGKITVSWKVSGERWQCDVTVPPNTEATITLPAKAAVECRVGGKPLRAGGGIRGLRQEAGGVTFVAAPGAYRFEVIRLL